MLFRKKYIKFLGWGKKAKNDQKVKFLDFLGGLGGFRDLTPITHPIFFKIYIFFVIANIYISILILKF